MGTIVSKDKPKSTQEEKNNLISSEVESGRELQESASSSMIQEKEHRRHKEQNEPETQMAITDAEKMLEIYRKEKKSGTDSTTVSRHKTEVYSRPKQYKTSDYDTRGRATNMPLPKTEEMSVKSVADNQANVSTKQTPVLVYNNSTYVFARPNIMQEGRMITASSDTTDNRQQQYKENYQREQNQRQYKGQNSPDTLQNDGIKEPGFLITKHNSKHSRNLLDQRAQVEISTPLKPLNQDRINIERQKLRSELESQGILAPGSYAEAAKKGILGELQDAGIISTDIKDEKYTLSSGSPVRRPPPRLTQLPPLREQPFKAREILFRELDKPLLPTKNRDFSFVDNRRPVTLGMEDPDSSSKTKHSGTTVEEEKENEEKYAIYKCDNICQTNMLKMKILNIEML